MYVEATMVIPLTFLITLALIGIMLSFHDRLIENIEVHRQERSLWSGGEEADYIRRYDSIGEIFEE